ncbi:MAG: aspartate--tRNA ligase [Micromonosporaceae bacterium]
MIRTHEAGALRAEQSGQQVTLAGWVARRRDHGGVTFIDLRDVSGVVQVVFRGGEAGAEREHSRSSEEATEVAHGLRNEFCVKVVGTVDRRPAGNENPELPTGEIEVTASELEVLAEAAPLPLPIDEHVDVGEETRLKYRYLDLRRTGPAAALRLRSEMNRIIRQVMHQHRFTEVETPTLTRSTPEGARDFVVPVRLQPGSWYALPQSPQLFKQLLMVAGVERYYQIARCYRDEDFRADRQPEFTQLDYEMSFVDRDDVLVIAEQVMAALWRELRGIELPRPFRRMTYQEAMDRYGSDKPDLRYGVELVDLSEYLRGTDFRVFAAALLAGGYVGAVVMPGGASQTRKELDGWQDWAKARGARGLAYVVFDAETGEPRGPVAKNLSAEHLAGLADAVGAKPGDAVFFAASESRTDAQRLLGAARVEIARRGGLADPDRFEFAFVVDFPMFERRDDGGWDAMHHPFCMLRPEWLDRFTDDPEHALADAYDLVCNGSEIMSGSIRIHRADIQQRVFGLIGLSREEAESKFGFLLEAFKYGPPPHGGAAPGLDRIAALLTGVDSIREVIAFPKSGNAYDPLTGAPTPITSQQRAEAGVDFKPKPKPAPGQPPAAG